MNSQIYFTYSFLVPELKNKKGLHIANKLNSYDGKFKFMNIKNINIFNLIEYSTFQHDKIDIELIEIIVPNKYKIKSCNNFFTSNAIIIGASYKLCNMETVYKFNIMPSYILIEWAIKSNTNEMLDHAKKLDPTFDFGQNDYYKLASEYGNLDALVWLQKNYHDSHLNTPTIRQSQYFVRELILIALKKIHLNVASWLFGYAVKNEFDCRIKHGEYFIPELAFKGNLESLICFDKFCNYSTYDLHLLLNETSNYGHICIFEWVFTKFPNQKFERDWIIRASYGGHIHLLNYLIDKFKNEFNDFKNSDVSFILISIAGNGHTHMLQWYKNNLPNTNMLIIKNLNHMINFASTNNHLDTIIWLHQNYLNEFDVQFKAIDGAIKGGHISILEWFLQNYPNKFFCSMCVLDGANNNVKEWMQINKLKLKYIQNLDQFVTKKQRIV